MKTYFEALLISTIALLAPIKAMLVTVTVLVAADMVFGIWAAKKRGEPVTSAGLRRSVSKTVIYLSAILLSYLTEKFLMDGALPASKIVAGLIGTVELKSVVESLDSINGTSAFKSFIQALGSKNDAPKE
jgi:hypothetical protein